MTFAFSNKTDKSDECFINNSNYLDNNKLFFNNDEFSNNNKFLINNDHISDYIIL